MPSSTRSNKASTGPMRTLTTTRQLRRGQSGVCRSALKSTAAQAITIRYNASPAFTSHPRPAPLPAAVQAELKFVANCLQHIFEERRRRAAAQAKLQQARLQLISQHSTLAALPLNQHQVARYFVPVKELVTPIAFRKQFTRKPSSLSTAEVNSCTCTAPASVICSSSSMSASWSDEEEDMDCDFEIPAEWGLSSAALARFGLSFASTCTCLEEQDDRFVNLPSLRRSLPDSALHRIAKASWQSAAQQERNYHLCCLWDAAVDRARAHDLPY